MTTGTEDALRAALKEAQEWIGDIGIERGFGSDAFRLAARLAAVLSLPSSGDQRDAVIERHAKAMSDALLKVRPLGGSELFVRVGDAYYADPKYCGDLIDKLRSDLHDAKLREAAALKSVMATTRASEEPGDDGEAAWSSDPKFRDWMNELNERVIQDEYGYERGEFEAFPYLWHPLYLEGLTPSDAFARALNDFGDSRNSEATP